MLRNSLILFLVIAVSVFTVSVKYAEAASFWSAVITGVTAIATIAAVILTGGAALAIVGFVPAFNLGGVGAAIITGGVACGTGLICGENQENKLVVAIKGKDDACGYDVTVNFYNMAPESVDASADVAVYRFSRGQNLFDLGHPEYFNFWLARWIGGGQNSEVNFYEAPWKRLAYTDFCDSSGVCRLRDQTAPAGTYVLYAARIMRSTGPALLSASVGAAPVMPVFSEQKYDKCFNKNGRRECRMYALGKYYSQGAAVAGPYKVDAVNPAACSFGGMPSLNVVGKGCDFVELGVLALSAEKYDVLRNGKLIASDVPASQRIYKDTGLIAGVSHDYVVVAKKGADPVASNIVSAAATCPLEQCGFSANPVSIVRGDRTTLNWNCVGVRVCFINGVSVLPSGTKGVAPQSSTDYTLSCKTSAGKNDITLRVSVGKVKIIEVRP